MVSHTSAVNGNVSSCRSAPDNLNCMLLTGIDCLSKVAIAFYVQYTHKWPVRNGASVVKMSTHTVSSSLF
jgi:hypothetical protein